MIREATPEDIPRLVDLGRVMHAESPVFRRLMFDGDRLGQTIATVIAAPRGFAYVVEADNEVQGGLLALITPHWFSPEMVSCDLALFIHPDYRGGASCARLLNAYAAWAKDMGCAMVQFGIMTGVHVEKTQALCEKLGWRRQGVVMEI